MNETHVQLTLLWIQGFFPCAGQPAKENKETSTCKGPTTASLVVIIIIAITIGIIFMFRSFKGSLGDGTTTGNIKTVGAPAQD